MKSSKVMGIVCNNCNTLNPLGRKTCLNCGQPLQKKKQVMTSTYQRKRQTPKYLLYLFGIVLSLTIVGAIMYGVVHHSFITTGAGTYSIIYENKDHQPVKKCYLVAWVKRGSHKAGGGLTRTNEFFVSEDKSQVMRLSLNELKDYAKRHPKKAGTYEQSLKHPVQLAGKLKFYDHYEILKATGNSKGTAYVSNDPQIKYYRYSYLAH